MPLLVDETLGYLRLAIGGISVTIIPLVSGSGVEIRTDNTQNPVTYSSYGTPLVQGFFYEMPYQWNIETYLDHQSWLDLIAIREESDYRRRNQDGDWRITLDDTIEPICERLPQSRASVDGTDTHTIEANQSNLICYFSRFNVFMPQRPIFAHYGNGKYRVSFQLQECGKFEP